MPAGLVRTLSDLIGVPAGGLTVGRFVHEVAKRGGFVGRRSDGQPGYRTLWQGWHELTLVHTGYRLAKGLGDVGND